MAPIQWLRSRGVPCSDGVEELLGRREEMLGHETGRGQTASHSFESEIQPPWQRPGLAAVVLDACAVPCQAACLGSKHEWGRRLLPHTAAACVLCGALSLADLVPLGQAGCISSKWAHAPSGCTAPGGAEGCPEAGESLPPPAPSSLVSPAVRVQLAKACSENEAAD